MTTCESRLFFKSHKFPNYNTRVNNTLAAAFSTAPSNYFRGAGWSGEHFPHSSMQKLKQAVMQKAVTLPTVKSQLDLLLPRYLFSVLTELGKIKRWTLSNTDDAGSFMAQPCSKGSRSSVSLPQKAACCAGRLAPAALTGLQLCLTKAAGSHRCSETQSRHHAAGSSSWITAYDLAIT